MRIILALALLSLALGARADETFPGIEKLMTPEEYRAAGLDKLTDEERAAFNKWLINYTAVEAPVILATNEEVKEAEDNVEIRASINPPFKGWSGKSRFTLDNGQIWEQRLSGRYVHTDQDTEVVITRNFLGFHKMTMVSTGKSVGVSRLK